ncbi:MAG: hypothetical protein L0332_10090 [Chloroflexi bacterium]|nr:hypothetical protein [Chloroflexota bacterium]
MTGFQWQTDEEKRLETPAVEAALPGRRRWRVVGLLLATIGIVALVAYQLARRQVAAATMAIEADVLSSHELVMQAARRDDAGLLTALLSGRDPKWTATQRELAEQGLLLNYPALGLQAQGQAGRVAGISLSPDLLQAEVRLVRPYVITESSGLTETVWLSQTAVYRQGADRWLYAPPDEASWGDPVTNRGERLTLIYPERDAAVAERLAADLERQLAELCLAVVACPEEFHLTVRLETDPAVLLELADPMTVLANGQELRLPAPSLVGRPVDEAGYQALRRGYAAQVVSAAITGLVGYRCCEQFLFYQALLANQLRLLELRPWPLTPADYEYLLNYSFPFNLSLLGDAWRISDPEEVGSEMWRLAHAVVEFTVGEDAELSAIALQRDQMDNGIRLSTLVANTFNSRWKLWRRFIYQRSLSGHLAAPPPLPEQDIQVVCTPFDGPGSQLYRLSPQTEEWTLERDSEFFFMMTPLPGGGGVVLQELGLSNQLFLWQEGQEELLYTFYDSASQFFSQPDPTGRRLVLNVTVGQNGLTHLLDLAQCRSGECELQPLPAWPIWSPDGSYTLLHALGNFDLTEPGRLSRGDSQGNNRVDLGTGSHPTWLDNETYGYIRRSPAQAFVTATVADDQTELLFTAVDLLNSFSDGDRLAALTIEGITASPADPNLLAALVFNPQLGQESYQVLFFDRQTRQAALQFRLDSVFAALEGFSPDGRWLLIRSFNPLGRTGSQAWALYIVDATGREPVMTLPTPREHFFNLDWSADGRWLLLNFDGFFDLVVLDHPVGPGLPYHRLIFHDRPGCSNAGWINKQ